MWSLLPNTSVNTVNKEILHKYSFIQFNSSSLVQLQKFHLVTIMKFDILRIFAIIRCNPFPSQVLRHRITNICKLTKKNNFNRYIHTGGSNEQKQKSIIILFFLQKLYSKLYNTKGGKSNILYFDYEIIQIFSLFKPSSI